MMKKCNIYPKIIGSLHIKKYNIFFDNVILEQGKKLSELVYKEQYHQLNYINTENPVLASATESYADKHVDQMSLSGRL
ncbi:MAG: hypothetical protein RCG15_00935 [Candidatus Rickettsia vulgarisii]